MPVKTAGAKTYELQRNADQEALVMLSDILPTGFECGALNGQVQPGDTVAIVGGRPQGRRTEQGGLLDARKRRGEPGQRPGATTANDTPANPSRSGAAVLLGPNPGTLRTRLRKYGIHRQQRTLL